MRILITGATGFLGKHLVPKLGFCKKVLCLVRKTSNIKSIKGKNVEFFYGDVTEKDSLYNAMKDTDIVIHAAALIYAKNKRDQYNVNVRGTKNVVDACKKNKIRKLIYLSTVAVMYGKKDSNYNYSLTKKQAEDIVMKSELNTVILRPAMVYGKGSRLTNIIKIVRVLPLIPMPEYMFHKCLQQPVYVDDVVRYIVTAVKSDKIKAKKPYYIAASKSKTVSEIIDETTIYPFKPLKIKVPRLLIKILVKIYQALVPGAPIKEEHLSKQHKVYHFDISETVKDFGYKPLDISEVIKRGTQL